MGRDCKEGREEVGGKKRKKEKAKERARIYEETSWITWIKSGLRSQLSVCLWERGRGRGGGKRGK